MKGGSSLLKNEYIFSLVSKVLMVVVGLAESALLARYLGAELRGSLAYIYSMSSTVYLLMTLGIYTAYPFMRKKDPRPVKQLIDEFMTVVSILFLIYFVVCVGAGLFFLDTDESICYILLLLPFMGYDKVVTFVFMVENPNRTNYISLLTNVVQCLFLVVCWLFSSKMLVVGVGFYVLGCLVRSVYFSRKLSFVLDANLFNLSLLWEYVKFGFFPMAALLLTTLNYRLDVIMLSHYSFISLSQIGIYSIGMGLSEKCLLIPDAMKEVLLSKLAKGRDVDEVAKVMRICFLASLLTALAIQISGGFIIDILYGKEYEGAEMMTYISVWGTTCMVFFKMICQYNVIQHRQHLNVFFLLASIATNFILNILLIPYWGISGAAVATVVGYLVSSSMFLFYFKTVSGIALSKMIFIQKEDFAFIKKAIR